MLTWHLYVVVLCSRNKSSSQVIHILFTLRSSTNPNKPERPSQFSTDFIVIKLPSTFEMCFKNLVKTAVEEDCLGASGRLFQISEEA